MELEQIQHPIQVAARRTGLTPEVIRAWERRYAAVRPVRSETGRRLYSDNDIERLLLLRRATLAGRSIGQVAGFSSEELRSLVAADEQAEFHALGESGGLKEKGEDSVIRHGLPVAEGIGSPYLIACMEALQRLDASALEDAFTSACVALGRNVLLEQVVQPLMEKIGDCWRNGSLRVMHEHLASAVVRSFLGGFRQGYETSEPGLHIVVVTPAGQIHEFGALLAAATAASEGYAVIYLGPSLPAEEIVGAVQETKAKVVALSIVYPLDDPRLDRELRQIRRFLPEDVALLVGGRGAGAYRETLQAIGAVQMQNLSSLRAFLEAYSGTR